MNPQVLKDTQTDADRFYDLTKHLDEMLNAIPEEKDKEIIIQNINRYYNSLNAVMINRML